ncbi:hypothetical protein [Streptomyces sp. CB00455]|uniref:hypothetical protein n=1 Tax=Streptomyces sp. CB00455 TaxID=1703927 RepID=UPI000AEC33AB|nr:hypothetical protein [Streptomyces sp. CB00455]
MARTPGGGPARARTASAGRAGVGRRPRDGPAKPCRHALGAVGGEGGGAGLCDEEAVRLLVT